MAADRVIRWTTAGAVAGAPAMAPYQHAHALVRAHREADRTGRPVPLTMDGLMDVTSIVILDPAADVVRSGGAPADAVRLALATLVSYTTAAIGYAAIWEGWVSGAPVPQAPRVPIPNRAMLLFTGPVEALRDAPALAWYGSATGVAQEPHLVWPEDHAWCLACEVDEEIEFTVGCSGEASQASAKALPGAVRRVRYGEPAPLYRDPA